MLFYCWQEREQSTFELMIDYTNGRECMNVLEVPSAINLLLPDDIICYDKEGYKLIPLR